MKKLQKTLALTLCALLLLPLLTACGEEEAETEEPYVLTAAICGATETLDPAKVTDAGTESMLATLFEGLMRMRDDGTGKAVAVTGIAKEYIEEKNFDDTVTYTFLLRSAARWSDGKRVKAEDFVYAWQRLADPATDSPNAALLSMVAGYDEVRESGDVTALGVKSKGDDTFIVTLSKPCAYFITGVCTAPATAPLRRDLVEGNEDWATRAELVTNGPYCVERWTKGTELRVSRCGEYYEGKLVLPDEICFRFETDAQANYESLLAGTLDYVAALPQDALEELAQDEEEPVALPAMAETVCVLYNHLTDTFSQAGLRRAFDLAIDRAALAEGLGAAASPATGCVPSGISNMPGDEEDFRTAGGALCAVDTEGYAERCAEAARAITGAGHYQGAGLPTLRLLFEEGEQTRAAAQRLVQMWRSVLGVSVEPVGMTAEDYAAALAAGQFDLALATLTSRFDDALRFLLPLHGTEESNVSGYNNDTFDLLVGVAESTGDSAARAAFLHDAEVMLLEDNALSPLFFRSSTPLLREGFTGAAHDCFGHSYLTAVAKADTGAA